MVEPSMKILGTRQTEEPTARFMKGVWEEAEKFQVKELTSGAKQLTAEEPWKIPDDPMITATKNSEILLAYPIVREAVQAAKAQVAQRLGIMPQEVYYRIVQPDDFSEICGSTPKAGQFEFDFTEGLNIFTMRNVGDGFNAVVLVGLLTTDIKEFVANVQVAINGNRLADYPAAFVKASQGDWFLLPAGPLLLSDKVRFSLVVTIFGLPNGAILRGRAFPLAIGFPV